MTLDYTHRPIGDRALFTGEHKASPFDSTFQQTLRLLEDELWHLDAENVVIEVDVTPADIRRDGKIRANARAVSPACRLVFDSVHGQLTYGTDRFTRNYKGPIEDWKHNLRAIALGLEALRKVDRYGIGQAGAQYTGYAELPAGGGGIALGGMTADEARSTLARVGQASFDLTDETATDTIAKVWRAARFNAHPDRNAGGRTVWDHVELAAKVLGLSS